MSALCRFDNNGDGNCPRHPKGCGREIQVTTVVTAPVEATHYGGDLLEDPRWYKCTQVGVVGDHWWRYDKGRSEWVFAGYIPPHRSKAIPS